MKHKRWKCTPPPPDKQANNLILKKEEKHDARLGKQRNVRFG